MAGNLVKWWKHKFLGGYKQFSVQECATDSEELIYHQVRASSSCSAPPDLLLVSDRENNLSLQSGTTSRINPTSTATSPVAYINTCALSNNNQSDTQKNHRIVKQTSTSHDSSCRDGSSKNLLKSGVHRQIPFDLQESQVGVETPLECQQSQSSNRFVQNAQQQQPEDHIRLEEFTCDVSVEGGKASQPLQFSFTFYDLDGHHGKITKDDIVGIVYTIYESIGKSVVVPHSGSKTINVRLTVSPEDKASKSSATTRVVPSKSCALEQQNVPLNKVSGNVLGRRTHRYRPRKLIRSDEEDDESGSDKERDASCTRNPGVPLLTTSTKNNRLPKNKQNLQCCQSVAQSQPNSEVNVSENMYNLTKKSGHETCRQCLAVVEENVSATISPKPDHILPNSSKPVSNEAFMKHAALTRMKLLRKSRKQKLQGCNQIRQRSLSVGNETCWNNRHLQKSQNQNQLAWVDQQLNNTDILDGVQLRNAFQAENTSVSQTRSSAECWKTPLNRNDLISIIRESMEKNRLCFQLNGKPQANVSPIRQQTPQRQSSNKNKHIPSQSRAKTRIPMLIANHNSRSIHFSNNNDSSLMTDHVNNPSILHNQPNMPMSHQQFAPNSIISKCSQNGSSVLNTRMPSQHGKMNLCGYDSFLHATICGGATLNHTSPISTSPHIKTNNQTNETSNTHTNYNSQIATVPPTILPALAVSPKTESKYAGIPVGSNHNAKTAKSPRNVSLPHGHHVNTTGNSTSHNSPQYHGYQRLPSGSKHIAQLVSPVQQSTDKVQNQLQEKFRSNQIQNYELYAKLTEKLQQTSLATSNKENLHRRSKHRLQRQRRSNGSLLHANKTCNLSLTASGKTEGYASVIPFCEDPVEFQNLIAQTSEDECHSPHENIESGSNDMQNSPETIHVAEATLVDLDLDEGNDDQAVAANQHRMGSIKHIPPSGDSKSGVDPVEDDLEIDDELDQDLADLEGIPVSESGRNSSISNDANDTIANTSATSSLIHRYVHEHIHHHYHHFEDKDE
ncbi:protein naked cuticle [Musca domestica]|uniref:Protein naked cuticle homolog n=1 Tax=Musca domestica TaxID=7370 RepID=A0A9J7CK99_MUSDO|nr:protein naked cuticle [Musca domestica]